MNVDISARAQTLINELLDATGELSRHVVATFIVDARNRQRVAKQHLVDYIAQLESCGGDAFPTELAAVEKIVISRALNLTKGNRSAAAELLGINVRTLRRRLNGGKR